MATYDLCGDFSSGSLVSHGMGVPLKGLKVFSLSNTVDLKDYHDNVQALAQADVLKVLKIPEKSVVLAMGARQVRAAAGTTLTITFAASGGGTFAGTTDGKATAETMTAATLTDGKIKATDTACFLTAVLTAVTSITDLGSIEFYAVVAKL